MCSLTIKNTNGNSNITVENHFASLLIAEEERINSDYRIYGSLLLLLGLCTAYSSFACVATLAGYHEGLGLAYLIAAVVQCFVGIVCMIIGYAAAVMGIGNKTSTFIAIVVIQMAWFTFMVDIYGIIKGIVSDPESNPFIPTEYDPDTTSIKFIGSMCFFAQIAYYAVGLIGSLYFVVPCMHNIQKGNHQDNAEHRFRRTATLYNAFLMLAGFTQIAIGSFVLNKYGPGPLQEPIFVKAVGVFGIIYFPEISVAVGALQLITGSIGLCRSLLKSSSCQTRSVLFQILCLITYLSMIFMQDLSQVAYAPGDEKAAMAPRLALLYSGLAFMPAFLDWKLSAVPGNLGGCDEQKVIGEISKLEEGEVLSASKVLWD